MTARMPPGELAQVDQDAARLRDLVAVARRHDNWCGQPPRTCPGAGVAAFLEDIDCATRDRLLMLAIAELAAASRGYGPRHGGAR